ncbi:MAG: hypothetical protein MI717_12470 [Spirochaetales bacterium]|nr:hypothetical protein [Spirochaetales bacterium]
MAAVLADFGFNCLWLNDDWQGADFIAVHNDGSTFLKVQLTGTSHSLQKIHGKRLVYHLSDSRKWYIYPHDELLEQLVSLGYVANTDSWEQKGEYSWPKIPQKILAKLQPYLLN